MKVTREYDDEGRLVRETVETEGETPRLPSIPRGGAFYPAMSCTCWQLWGSVMPPPPCPVHGQSFPVQITCTSNTAVAS